ncbi:MAG: superoxide dismutase [Planctomycetes bacterium]|nr:superoxide dismutase [Planctomycetota bacterium]
MAFQKYTAKDYSKLRGLQGITDEQVEVHLTLYNGYVNRTNALQERLFSMAQAGTFDNAYQELKRRNGWEWNGMRLHEFYFDNLTPSAKPLAQDNAFAQAVAGTYGSLDGWKNDFMNTAKMPGVGWIIAYQDPVNGQVLNCWINQHEVSHLSGARPILVLDVWEHAFSVYRKPTERAKYLDDFMANVDWNVVAKRLG